MTANSLDGPFEILVDLASRSLQQAQGLPAQVDIKPHWSGIGFLLGGHRFVAPMTEVAEILAQPPSTRLPGVHPWVRGVANVRGRLLPLMDMESFFGGNLSGGRKKRRVLVLELGELYSGLIVNEIYGMQHFPEEDFNEGVSEDVSGLSSFIEGSYQQNGVTWTVFSPFKLVQNTEFMNAAAG